MYDVSTKPEERELEPVSNGSGNQAAEIEKEREALEESAIVVPPPTEPRSAISTEGMHMCMCAGVGMIV